MSSLEGKLPTEQDNKWMLPRKMREFVRLLAESPVLGSTDTQRVRRFLTFPQADNMPASLRKDLERTYG